jgi:catechol-2,3-dioxygenase
MKLNHLHLMVTDVRLASAFLETYFGLRSTGGNAGLIVLSDDDGFVLTLMKIGQTSNTTYPTNFHVGFFVESEATVDTIYHRLKDDGYKVSPPERQQHSYSLYVDAPGGFTVELGA